VLALPPLELDGPAPDELVAALAPAGARHAEARRHALNSNVRKRGGISLSSAYGVS
jgi:hypothetical protein